jgi:hypothetical protein
MLAHHRSRGILHEAPHASDPEWRPNPQFPIDFKELPIPSGTGRTRLLSLKNERPP